MTTYIRVTGPHSRLSHVGQVGFWTVGIVNDSSASPDTSTDGYLDLVPWNERGALGSEDARAIAAFASRVTGFPVRVFRVKTTTTTTLVEET